MAFPANREQLVILLGLAEGGVRPFLLGRGTNLLVDDRGLDTLVIKTAERMTSIRRLDDVDLGGRRRRPARRLAVYAPAGRPGRAGICPRHPRNSGRRGVHECRRLRRRDAPGGDGGHRPVSPGIRRFTGDQAEFAYRHSRFLEDGAVVLGAVVRLTPTIPPPSGSGWMT